MALKPFARIPLTRSPGSSGSSASSGGGGSENGPLGLGRTCTLRVSFAGLLASAIILMIALGWMFAFGVIVGRGYDPEEKLPRLAFCPGRNPDRKPPPMRRSLTPAS